MVSEKKPDAELAFALREYVSLWEDWGVSDLAALRAAPLPVLNDLPKALPMTPAPAPRVGIPPPTVAPPPPVAVATATLEDVRRNLGDCQRCGLCEQRQKIVFGEGTARMDLMFLGEGPGPEEDTEGRPFVGKPGHLLDKIIEAMGQKRDAVYLTTVVKCRPPGNRTPRPPEIAECLPFLREQIAIVQPRVIVCLGLTAAASLLGELSSLSSARGKPIRLSWRPETQVIATYHPAYLLRNPAAKKDVWEDMKLVLSLLSQK